MDDAIWEPFEFEITNFKFKEGFIHKLSVIVTKKSAPSSGLSPVKNYRLEKVLLKEIDHALNFSGMFDAYFTNDFGEENED